MSEPVPDNWLHIYGQYMWHDHAVIRGTREGLARLRAAIDKAIECGDGEAEVFASDGEGYGVIVIRASTMAALGQPEYQINLEADIAYRARERFQRHTSTKERG